MQTGLKFEAVGRLPCESAHHLAVAPLSCGPWPFLGSSRVGLSSRFVLMYLDMFVCFRFLDARESKKKSILRVFYGIIFGEAAVPPFPLPRPARPPQAHPQNFLKGVTQAALRAFLLFTDKLGTRYVTQRGSSSMEGGRHSRRKTKNKTRDAKGLGGCPDRDRTTARHHPGGCLCPPPAQKEGKTSPPPPGYKT